MKYKYNYHIDLPIHSSAIVSGEASYEEITDADRQTMKVLGTPHNPKVTKGWKIRMDEESMETFAKLFKAKQIYTVPFILSDGQLRLLNIIIVVQHDDNQRIPAFFIKFALLAWCYMLFAEGEEKGKGMEAWKAALLDCFSPERLCWEEEILSLQYDTLKKEVAHKYKYKISKL